MLICGAKPIYNETHLANIFVKLENHLQNGTQNGIEMFIFEECEAQVWFYAKVTTAP